MLGGKTKLQQIVPFRGKSMWPLIQEGDKVVVDLFTEPRPLDDSFLGDLCFYNDGNEWVVHRALDFEGDIYIKGDYAKSFDVGPNLMIWGRVLNITKANDKVVVLSSHKLFNKLCAKLSALHMSNHRFKGKYSKAILYVLNFLNRHLKF